MFGGIYIMQEEYWIEKMIKAKSKKELEAELIYTIVETEKILEVARCNFEYAEDGLIDYYIYQIKANQAKLDYLLKLAKASGIAIDAINQIKYENYDEEIS